MYKAYKNARDVAWQVLIDCNIVSLPIKFKAITEHFNVKIKDNADVNLLNDNQLGCLALIKDNLYIILDRTVPIQRQRYTIAHEIGHIALNHNFKETLLMRENKNKEVLIFSNIQEYQAERFAMNLLTPACVLWGLNLRNAEDIAKICNISMNTAKKRSERMRILYKRNAFLTSDLERQVYQQFKNFIEKK